MKRTILIAAIRAVVAGDAFFSPAAAKVLVRDAAGADKDAQNGAEQGGLTYVVAIETNAENVTAVTLGQGSEEALEDGMNANPM